MNPLQHPLLGPIHSKPSQGSNAYLSPSIVTKQAHIVRLTSLLQHLLTLPPSPTTSLQALKAWRLLSQCKEVNLTSIYSLGLKVLSVNGGNRLEWIERSGIGSVDKCKMLHEIVLEVVNQGKIKSGIEELER